MAGTFLTKKHKTQMRERRKKKRKMLSLSKNNNNDSAAAAAAIVVDPDDTMAAQETDISEVHEFSGLLEIATPRADVDDSKEEDKRNKNKEGGVKLKKRKRSLELESKTIDGKLYVLIPNRVATKDIKKFRKDARRQLRDQGKDDTNIVFVEEDELPASFKAKKKKNHFPSIKELLLKKKESQQAQKEDEKQKEKIHDVPEEVKSKYVALDCEMVGIGTDGKKSALARVSIVDWDLNVVLDTFVKVPIRVTDFRTHVSGVEPKHIKDRKAMPVEECRNKVAEILKDRILVGHALINDFKALMLNHPKADIRDTAKYRPFQRYGNGKWRPRKLRDLVKENLKGKENFQEAEHDSVEDAKNTMELFQVVRKMWEKDMTNKK